MQKAAVLARQTKSEPICPASAADTPHPYSLKTLRDIVFTEEGGGSKTKSGRLMCPSCMKTLGNASLPLMAINCGHVLCRGCVGKLIGSTTSRKEQEPCACFVCDQTLALNGEKDDPDHLSTGEFRGMVELRSEGTGFSARGGNKIQKEGVAFQC